MGFINNKDIADDKQEEQVLKGIQPKNQLAFKIYKFCKWVSIGLLAIALLGLGSTFIPSESFELNQNEYYRKAIFFIAISAVAMFLFALLVKLLFLRKPPFDDWVFDIAQKRLGTDVIFYTSKCLYIQYDRSGKEVDKREFVTEMSDKSIHYSYFYVKTFIDQGVIQIECTRRQPIPNMARFKPDDDIYWNIVPLGLTINNITQTVSPMGWYLNDQNKDDRMIATVPSTSILICGGTGSGKSVMEQAIVGHVSRYPDNFQLVGVDCKRVNNFAHFY